MALTKVRGEGLGTLVSDLTITSTDADASAGPTIDLYRNSASPADGDLLGRIKFTGESSGTGIHTYGLIDMEINGVNDGNEQAKMILKVSLPDGDLQNVLHVDRTEVCVNEDSENIDFRVEGNSNSHALYVEANTDNISMGSSDTTPGAGTDARLNIITKNGGQAALVCFNAGTGAVNQVSMENGNGQVGRIQTSGSSTSYLTSSDYRLKENVDYTWDATTRLKQLKPARFNFITDTDTTIDGFLAHEVSNIVPEAISGEKDAMIAEVLYANGDEIPDGKKVGDVKRPSRINPQAIDQSKLVPLLVKTIQELEARITALESA